MDCIPVLSKASRLLVGKYANYRKLRRLLPTTMEKKTNLNLFRNIRVSKNEFELTNKTPSKAKEGSFELIPKSRMSCVYPLVEHVLKTYSYFGGSKGNYSVDVHVVREVTPPTPNNKSSANTGKEEISTNSSKTSSIAKLHEIESDFVMAGLVLDLKNVKPAMARLYSDDTDIYGTKAVAECDLAYGEYLIFDNKEHSYEPPALCSNDAQNEAVKDFVTVSVSKI